MMRAAVSNAHFTFDSEEHYESGTDLRVTDYSTGLIRRGESGFHVLTGIELGIVGVNVEVLEREPRSDASEWGDVVEFELAAQSRAAVLHDYFAQASVLRVDLRNRGRFTVRASARGRDLALDSASEMDELYRLQLWPADADPRTARAVDGSLVRVIKADSEASRLRLASLQPMLRDGESPLPAGGFADEAS